MIVLTLLLHVSIALSSVAFSSYLLVVPVAKKFKIAYGLVAATFASGTYLVIATHSPLLGSCVTGLAYLAVVGGLIASARYRLTLQKATVSHK